MTHMTHDLQRAYRLNTGCTNSRHVEVQTAECRQAYHSENKCSAVTEMGDGLATIDMDRKVVTFWGRRGVGEGWNLKQLQGTSADVEWST